MILGKPLIIGSSGTPEKQFPPGYKGLTYIQTDGSAFIDLGASFSGEGKFKIANLDRTYTSAYYAFGCAESGGASRCELSLGINSMQLYYTKQSTYSAVTTYFPDDFANSPTDVFMHIKDDFVGIKESNYYSGGSNVDSVVTPQTSSLYLFAQNHNGTMRSGSSIRMKGFMWWDGPLYSLIRDMWACERESDNAIGMYDFKNNTFFGNAGSGAFTKGAYL